MYALLISQNADEMAVLSLVLQRGGLTVTTNGDPELALKAWPEHPADLILIAWQDDPLSYIRRFRAVTQAPIILVIDPPSEDTHYQFLDAGADFVAPRPYSARLLIAQVRALLRRSGNVPVFSLPTLSLAGLSLDPATRTVQVSGKPTRRLTQLEFRLLYTLMIHREQILSNETIVERVWGYGGRGDKELVRGLVRRLRSKIEPHPGTPRYILTVPGVGYCFQCQHE